MSAEWPAPGGRFVQDCFADAADAWADTRAGQALCDLAAPLSDLARDIALVEAGDMGIDGLHDRLVRHRERINAALETLYEAPDEYARDPE